MRRRTRVITQPDGLFYEMSRVFVSESTGAAVYVHSHDHCSPHVHAQHRRDAWVARVAFSYVDSEVELKDIAPTNRPPPRRILNAVVSDVQGHLADCRRTWWTVQQTTGLANRWAIVPAPGVIELLPMQKSYAKQIADARYDPASQRLLVIFRDGSRVETRI